MSYKLKTTKVRISRENLMNKNYVPDLKEELDEIEISENELKEYYEPIIEFLYKIYTNKN
ncbi:hypothetical protein [Clostridium butyricum]|uniref:hypothetical protein n=1 Tax=Clostridium butyricum TaxID=1492 RepID=UPI0002CB3A8D|nr:hypothetical protein [Clostridium butyricum]EMU52825.1 hypothetical protein CBDKU1_31970 [Clostridium butyricum DKU-01]